MRDLARQMSREIIRTKTFARDAARKIVDVSEEAVAARGEFRIALSGGNTPRPVYSEIGKRVPWERSLITFSDERCVPPDHAESNYRMAQETLFRRAVIPESSVSRMQGEMDPQLAALDYENKLNTLAMTRGEPIYRHDLILLGLGDDGHTASLFPGTSALNEDTRHVVANFVEKVDDWRLTFTFPMINQARHICFLVNNSKDSDLIERVLNGDEHLPASRVKPVDGVVTWIIEENA